MSLGHGRCVGWGNQTRMGCPIFIYRERERASTAAQILQCHLQCGAHHSCASVDGIMPVQFANFLDVLLLAILCGSQCAVQARCCWIEKLVRCGNANPATDPDPADAVSVSCELSYTPRSELKLFDSTSRTANLYGHESCEHFRALQATARALFVSNTSHEVISRRALPCSTRPKADQQAYNP